MLALVAAMGGAAGASKASVDPRRCSLEQKVALVRALSTAFNAGNDLAVHRLVAAEPAFQWFSAPGSSRDARRLGPEAYDRSTLREYVRQRHRHRERWTNVEFGGELRLPLTLTREADDYRRSRVRGKVDAICTGRSARIIAWSL